MKIKEPQIIEHDIDSYTFEIKTNLCSHRAFCPLCGYSRRPDMPNCIYMIFEERDRKYLICHDCARKHVPKLSKALALINEYHWETNY